MPNQTNNLHDLRGLVPPGLWAIEPSYGVSEFNKLANISTETLALFSREGARPAKFNDDILAAMGFRSSSADETEQAKRYIVKNGVAVVSIDGPLTKDSFCDGYGSTSSVVARRTLQSANRDNSVRSILLRIDSPGGAIAGISELSKEVAKIAASYRAGTGKKIVAYCDDTCCSAAYWVASGANEIYANDTAVGGSLGGFAVVHDLSQQYKDRGVEVIVISEGKNKGMGTPGTKITADHKAKLKERVTAMVQPFKSAVASGRGFDEETIAQMFTGDVWVGEGLVSAGLVDAIKSLDDVLSEMEGSDTQTSDIQPRKVYTMGKENGIVARMLAVIADSGSDDTTNASEQNEHSQRTPPSGGSGVTQVHSQSAASMALIAALAAHGIGDVASLNAKMASAAIGEKRTTELKALAEGEAIRLYGAEKAVKIAAGISSLDYDTVKAIVEGWSAEADAKFGIGKSADGGGARQSAAGPAAQSENAEGNTPNTTLGPNLDPMAGVDPNRIKSLMGMTSVGERALALNGKAGNGHSAGNGRNN